MRTKAPLPFLWGAATSSHQVEGHNDNNDWWHWEKTGVIDGGVCSGRASDHLTRFREDLRLAKSLGLNSYRFSFEWSRLEPKEGQWDQAAFDWYNELITECESLGILPMATLHHFTLPLWVAERGGFANAETPAAFAKFTSRVARAFGSRIPLWCTINEPMVLVAGGYLGHFMPPGKWAPEAASRACRNLLASHVLAYDTLKTEIGKREGPFASRPLEVGFAHNMLHFLPDRAWHPIDFALSKGFRFLYNSSWLRATNGEYQTFGFPGVFPFAPQLQGARRRKTFDFIGVNYYTKGHIRWKPRTKVKEQSANAPVGMTFARRKEVASDLDWAIHPRGFANVLRSLKRFRAPIYITENGIADANDEHRSHYIKSHLLEVAAAREYGLDVRGYYHWSLIDNFEWIKGFWPRFGLASVDYETFERKLRPSSQYYKKVILSHGEGKAPSSKVLNRL